MHACEMLLDKWYSRFFMKWPTIGNILYAVINNIISANDEQEGCGRGDRDHINMGIPQL